MSWDDVTYPEPIAPLEFPSGDFDNWLSDEPDDILDDPRWPREREKESERP